MSDLVSRSALFEQPSGIKYEFTLRMEINKELSGELFQQAMHDAFLLFCAKSGINPAEFINAEAKLCYGWAEGLILRFNSGGKP